VHHATTGSGIGGTHGSTNAGPHNSNLLNQADPRVDSDRDGRSGLGGVGHGTTAGHTGAHGTTGTYGATGAHGTSGTHNDGNTTGSGLPSAQKSAHGSQLLNKLDPRVKNDKEGNPTH
jgi:hypothetical protein